MNYILPLIIRSTRCSVVRVLDVRLALALLMLANGTLSRAALLFSENIGSPLNTTAISINSFQNPTLTFTGTGDVRITTSSTGYAECSGGGNVFLSAGSSKSFVIGSISTVGFTDLALSFGAHKSVNASSMSELALSYSIDGGTSYVPLSIPIQASGLGTSNWRLISGIALPSTAEGISDLRFMWVNNAATGGVQFRLDDVSLSGMPIPEPSTYLAGALLGVPFGVHGIRWLRHRRRS